MSDSTMFTKQVQDFDGSPFYFAISLIPEYEDGSPVPASVVADVAERDLARAHMELISKATAVGCLLREVPQLGSRDEGPFHPAFEAIRTHGVITAIRIIPENMTPGRWS